MSVIVAMHGRNIAGTFPVAKLHLHWLDWPDLLLWPCTVKQTLIGILTYNVDYTYVCSYTFLNQARTWFLEIAFVHQVSVCVHVCVCPPPRALITTHVK